MPPMPKEPSTRRRRNKTATSRQLQVVHDVDPPALPGDREWHAQTVAWWTDVWASPMAPEFDDSDLHGLVLLAVLVDAFWESPSKELAAEIRLQRQCFGLSPIDRRRLQWEIDRGTEAEQRTQKRRTADAPRPSSTEGTDPRQLLA